MTKSRFVLDKLSKFLEEGIVNYKDLTNEVLNILKSKREEVIFRMKLTSKEETEIIKKRVENLEKKIEILEKKKVIKKTKRAKKL
jgi:hypothetical protein|tara:strand:- start:1083 stop:1337 length:255 start_codon:yes stop_codon:yes gene_type:complete